MPSEFISAVYQGDIEKVKICLLNMKGSDIDNDTSHSGLTALHIAVSNRYVEIAELLIMAGANINKIGGVYLCPPLYVALYGDNRDIINLFIKYGADLNIKNKMGLSYIHIILPFNIVDIVALVSSPNINLNIQDNKGHTPLHRAKHTAFGCEYVTLLLQHGANPNIANNKGLTLLYYVILGNRIDIFKVLLEYGADILAKDGNGNNAIQVAQQYNRTEIIEILGTYFPSLQLIVKNRMRADKVDIQGLPEMLRF